MKPLTRKNNEVGFTIVLKHLLPAHSVIDITGTGSTLLVEELVIFDEVLISLLCFHLLIVIIIINV